MNWRRPAFLLAHDFIGSRLRGHYAEFLAASSWSAERLDKVHHERLDALLRHAVQNVPFYRDRAASADLGAFPILRKADVPAHFEELMEPSLLAEYRAGKKPRGYSWVEVKTGGTTGTPTRVIHDTNFRDWGRAGRLYSQWLCGFPIGTPFFQLWGSMRDINDARESATKRAMSKLLQVHPLNAFLMDEERIKSYLLEIEDSPIDHLMAYVDAADQLARFQEKSGRPMRTLQSIMACAGTVTDDIRDRLHRVFGARVHNKYGSRECADIACECAVGGFHIYSTGIHLEVVDEAGRAVTAGTTGRILITLLHNLRFPMIRYEIGDLGAPKDGTCACGSLWPLLARVEGRSTEMINAVDGSYISPVYLRHLVGVVHGSAALERFQFVQEEPCTYALALQMDASVSNIEFTALREAMAVDLQKVLGQSAELTITRESRLNENASGKFLYVIRRPKK